MAVIGAEIRISEIKSIVASRSLVPFETLYSRLAILNRISSSVKNARKADSWWEEKYSTGGVQGQTEEEGEDVGDWCRSTGECYSVANLLNHRIEPSSEAAIWQSWGEGVIRAAADGWCLCLEAQIPLDASVVGQNQGSQWVGNVRLSAYLLSCHNNVLMLHKNYHNQSYISSIINWRETQRVYKANSLSLGERRRQDLRPTRQHMIWAPS